MTQAANQGLVLFELFACEKTEKNLLYLKGPFIKHFILSLFKGLYIYEMLIARF